MYYSDLNIDLKRRVFMTYIKLLTLLIACFNLFGCSSTASIDELTFKGQKRQYPERLSYKIELSSIEVNKGLNAQWLTVVSQQNFYSALKRTLLNQGLLSDNGNFMLEVEFVNEQQHAQSFDREVISHIKYKFIDTIRNQVVFDEVIISSYKATLNDALSEDSRINFARQKSAQKSIELLLDRLTTL